MGGVTDTFLDYGVLGAVVVVLLIAVAYLFKQLQSAHKDTQDAHAAHQETLKKTTATLLAVNERWHEVIDDLANEIERLREREHTR